MMSRSDSSRATAFDEKALKTVRRKGLFSNHGSVLAALSGGKDSVALLMFLLRTSKITGISVYAAHLNHALRGEEADGDEKFVRELCERFSVRLFVKKLSPGDLNVSGKTIEEAAREARYGFFDEICERENIDLIATAHTASDNSETVLMNLMRGSGLQGICGIPSVRGNIVRPLSDMTSNEIISYLSQLGEKYVTDSSNLTDDYTRNLIRHRIIPVFKKKNPSFDASVARLSELASYDMELISRIANNEAERIGVDLDSNSVELDALRMIATDSAYTGVLYNIISRLTGNISAERFFALRALILSKKACGRIELGDDREIILDGRHLKVVKSSGRHENNREYSVIIEPGTNRIDEIDSSFLFETEINSNSFDIIHTINRKLRFNYKSVIGDIYLRSRRPGDEIRMGGITKRIKKLFGDRGISSADSRYFPIVCDEGGIIAVCGLGICDRVRIDNLTEVANIEIIASPVESLFNKS